MADIVKNPLPLTLKRLRQLRGLHINYVQELAEEGIGVLYTVQYICVCSETICQSYYEFSVETIRQVLTIWHYNMPFPFFVQTERVLAGVRKLFYSHVCVEMK